MMSTARRLSSQGAGGFFPLYRRGKKSARQGETAGAASTCRVVRLVELPRYD